MQRNASFLLRCKAFLIDYIWIAAYLMLLVVVSVLLLPSLQEWFSGSLIVAQLAGFVMVTLPVSVYFIVGDSGRRQSFGKKKTGIRVIDMSGRHPSVARMIFRTVIKFLPWELSHFLVYRMVSIGDGTVPLRYYVIGGLIYGLIIAYAATAICTRKKRSVYDLIAGTQVVHVR